MKPCITFHPEYHAECLLCRLYTREDYKRLMDGMPSQATPKPLVCIHMGRPVEIGPCERRKRICRVYGHCSVKPAELQHCLNDDGTIACKQFEEI